MKPKTVYGILMLLYQSGEIEPAIDQAKSELRGLVDNLTVCQINPDSIYLRKSDVLELFK
jgi:hypothetical protein